MAFIRRELAEHFPDDGVVAEEGGSAGLQARCIWVIDPVDGAACFLNGLHNCCMSIGLLLHGAIADPNHDELFHGFSGRGAFVNDTPLQAHGARHVREGLVGVGKEHFLPFLHGLLDEGGTVPVR